MHAASRCPSHLAAMLRGCCSGVHCVKMLEASEQDWLLLGRDACRAEGIPSTKSGRFAQERMESPDSHNTRFQFSRKKRKKEKKRKEIAGDNAWIKSLRSPQSSSAAHDGLFPGQAPGCTVCCCTSDTAQGGSCIVDFFCESTKVVVAKIDVRILSI